jgi:transcriptional regulator with XRE-family HTH domain
MFVSPGPARRPSPPSPELLALAHAIRQARRAKDLSQEALAALADVHPKHLSEIERANKDPRATTLIRLAEALGLTPAELYAASEGSAAEGGGKAAAHPGASADAGGLARS